MQPTPLLLQILNNLVLQLVRLLALIQVLLVRRIVALRLLQRDGQVLDLLLLQQYRALTLPQLVLHLRQLVVQLPARLVIDLLLQRHFRDQLLHAEHFVVDGAHLRAFLLYLVVEFVF